FVITISPPSNPISTRVTSEAMAVSSILDVLDEHPGDAAGMDERHLEPEQADPRLRVDQLGPGRGGLAERGADVVDEVGDVVHPWAAALDEPPHRRVGRERPEELDPVGA